ncbi:hypothetical protein U6A24_09810 [Aquimarina gracilis]|uniref:Uncharacterized protein n=1 Tax=Aquimarina gracilis TaxID=874422 RepID=A0ABU5ZVI7_9FLAO|nr:hypothetical protein [Aquimarina gracilis]MEB3345757.1 hypothetical protein [Aquimarina gracilis]
MSNVLYKGHQQQLKRKTNVLEAARKRQMSMKVFQPNFSDHIEILVKEKLLLLLIISFCLLSLNAQVKLRIEPGVLLDTDSENLGLLLNIEPKVKASENVVIGLRLGIAINPQKFEID